MAAATSAYPSLCHGTWCPASGGVRSVRLQPDQQRL